MLIAVLTAPICDWPSMNEHYQDNNQSLVTSEHQWNLPEFEVFTIAKQSKTPKNQHIPAFGE